MRITAILLSLFFLSVTIQAQIKVDLAKFNWKTKTQVSVKENLLDVRWPAGDGVGGSLLIDLSVNNPIFKSVDLKGKEGVKNIFSDVNPEFILTVGKRDLVSQNGWNIFFDATAYKPHTSHLVKLDKRNASVTTFGSRTIISIGDLTAGKFSGELEVTLFEGSPLINIAAVMTTKDDSTAIIYDAGLVSRTSSWKQVFWSDTDGYLQSSATNLTSPAENLKVKYRTVIAESKSGSVAVFPSPHQYFYPLDNAYNLKFVWAGKDYRNSISGTGIGIRQDLMGDMRYVPWFNAPPGTQQRLNFFCLLSTEKNGKVLEEVKKFTNADSYKPLPGFYTLASHFHTEHTDDILTHKPLPETPGFVKALKNTGVNIMHLGEFHLAGNPRDPGPRRLLQYKTMFDECRRLSVGDFLMLPGEEPNQFFGGHWMNIFPKPVYWTMVREPGQPFVEEINGYGKVYHVGDKNDMLKLLEAEKGLAWTAHARTKGSLGFPDKHKNEDFYKSDRFMGAAWKNLPADLSQDRLGKRALDLMDDMANWGFRKHMIGEADIFKIEPSYELYSHLNVNYLQLKELPSFDSGWQPVLDAIEQGKFFVSTGEVLLPQFSVNNKTAGEVLKVDQSGEGKVSVDIEWTFPLAYAEIISGDGAKVYRQRVNLNQTTPFGKQNFQFDTNLKGKTWVRLEVWDVAVNGAFTQQVWLEK